MTDSAPAFTEGVTAKSSSLSYEQLVAKFEPYQVAYSAVMDYLHPLGESMEQARRETTGLLQSSKNLATLAYQDNQRAFSRHADNVTQEEAVRTGLRNLIIYNQAEAPPNHMDLDFPTHYHSFYQRTMGVLSGTPMEEAALRQAVEQGVETVLPVLACMQRRGVPEEVVSAIAIVRQGIREEAEQLGITVNDAQITARTHELYEAYPPRIRLAPPQFSEHGNLSYQGYQGLLELIDTLTEVCQLQRAEAEGRMAVFDNAYTDLFQAPEPGIIVAGSIPHSPLDWAIDLGDQAIEASGRYEKIRTTSQDMALSIKTFLEERRELKDREGGGEAVSIEEWQQCLRSAVPILASLSYGGREVASYVQNPSSFVATVSDITHALYEMAEASGVNLHEEARRYVATLAQLNTPVVPGDGNAMLQVENVMRLEDPERTIISM